MIAVSSSGKSFRALAAYLASGRSGEERDRVGWSAARNLPTNEPELAAKFMRATAAQSSRVEKPVYHIVLSFDPADGVDRAKMERVADRVLDRLGLAGNQAVIVAHRDREHAHVHLLINRVHPETGRAWERWRDQPLIQQVLREEEKALGLRPVTSSLTREASDQPSRIAHEVGHDTTTGKTRQVPASGERGGDRALNEILEALEQHERSTALKHEVRVTRSEVDAAQARLARLDLAHARAQAVGEEFRRLLENVYHDVDGAHRLFVRRAREVGAPEAARGMSERPEQFGALLTTERRVLGLRTTRSDQDARAHARSAARAGEDSIAAEGRMWAAASEARVRRLEEAFAGLLRGVFVDEKAAAAAFAEMATRDGPEAAATTLRTAPHQLGALRQDCPAEPNERQPPLDRAAAAGAEVVRARRDLEPAVSPPLSRELAPAGPALAIAELQATREHVALLAERERSARETLGRLPRRHELEHRIGQMADRLLPHEIRKLKTLATAPHLALLAKIRSTVRDALLARDERSA